MSAAPTSIPESSDLASLAHALNEKLEEAARDSVNHAFNVSCSVSLLPVAVLVVAVFFLSRANWVVSFVAAVVGVMLALGFAALVSNTARARSIERTYQLYVAPSIERYLSSAQLTRAEFDLQAAGELPEGALLKQYLAVPERDGEDEPETEVPE
jgi:hypothetical protein